FEISDRRSHRGRRSDPKWNGQPRSALICLRCFSCVVPHSKPSAMLLEIEIDARSIWSFQVTAASKIRLLSQGKEPYGQFNLWLEDRQIVEALVFHRTPHPSICLV